MSIKLNGINCFYGAHQALFDITLNCPEGETLVLLGPSGAGKSSLLRVLNLLEMPRSGTLAIAGNHFDFAKTPSDKAIRELRQNVGMVFQQYNLWPHLTVLQNLIEAPCRVLGLSKDQAIARAEKLLERLRLKPYSDRYPLHLSGGQQQRVAIARALMMEPRCCCLMNRPRRSTRKSPPRSSALFASWRKPTLRRLSSPTKWKWRVKPPAAWSTWKTGISLSKVMRAASRTRKPMPLKTIYLIDVLGEMIMKKVLIAALLAGVSLSATAAQTIRFATEASYPPFESIDANNKIVGFDVDLANALCKEIDATCTFSNQAFDSLIPSLKFRRIDAVMAGMDITPEREKQVLFSTPYYDNSALFIGQKGKFTSVDQLKGKKVGVQNGTTHQKFIMDKHPEITTVPYDSYQNAKLDLQNGRIDGVFGDTAVVTEWLKATTSWPLWATK
jgi:arginine transport system substrate-binding protein